MSYGDIDSWTIARDGINYRIDLTTDYESNEGDITRDDESLSPSDVQAHKDGLWQYVGVTVTPLVNGIDSEGDSYLSQSLWGVPYGDFPAETEPHMGGMHGETCIGRTELAREPIPSLVTAVRADLARLRDKLAALPLADCPATHLRTEDIREPFTVHCERAMGHEMPHRVMDYGWTD